LGFTVFVYQYTIPNISRAKKILLIILRSLGLAFLLLAIFEPTLTLTRKETLTPKILFYVDNSRSIAVKDEFNKSGKVSEILQELNESELKNAAEIKTFGNKIHEINADSLQSLNFTEGSTNFAKIFEDISNFKGNLSAAVILSDGVVTDGVNPTYLAEKNNIPIYTVGVGDTSVRKDIAIKNSVYNEYIYAETPTVITFSIVNNGFSGNTVNLSTFENDILIDQQKIVLSPDGIQNVQINYLPKSSGEKKISIQLSNIKGEYSKENNRKVFYINVLSNKVKVMLVAGSPSSDLSFIKNILLSDENLSVNSLTQVSANKYLEKNNPEKLLDSADVLFLIGFPSNETSDFILNEVKFLISEKNIPFFIVLSNNINLQKLNPLRKEMAFIWNKVGNEYSEVQPSVTSDQAKNPIIQTVSGDLLELWNNLPPVMQMYADFKGKPESEVIAQSKINNVPTNIPLIISRSLGDLRSIAVLAKDIWKWKLETTKKNQELLDNFIINSIRWLNSPEDKKRIQIKTIKKVFSPGEEVEFTAQIYDDSFNPISDAEVKVTVRSDDYKSELILNPLGNGLYDGILQTNKPGNYSYVGEARLNDKSLGNDNGKFNIGEIDVEMINTGMNYEFLSTLSNVSGGKFYSPSQYNLLFSALKDLNSKSIKENFKSKEISLWSNELLLILIILLFTLEWFFRKRDGML
jgi:hypothetical protein